MNFRRIVNLHDGEKVAAVVRNHWLSFFWGLSLPFTLIVAAFFFMVPLFRFGTPGLVAFGLLTFGGLFWFLRTVFLWYWNAFIVTSERIVDVDQRGLFDRTVSEAPFDKIQDVSYQVKGILGTVLNVGTVIVQTAGTNTNLELLHVHRPQDIQHLINLKMVARHEAQSRPVRTHGLVATAAEMSDAEARAFVTGLQQAMSEERSKADAPKPPPAGGPVLPDDWRGPGEEDDGLLTDWRKKRI